MRASGALARALLAPALAAAISTMAVQDQKVGHLAALEGEGDGVTSPNQEQGARSALEEVELLMDPRSSVTEAISLVDREFGTPHFIGKTPPPNAVVITRHEYIAALVSYVMLWSAAIAFTGFLYQRAKVWPSVVDSERQSANLSKWSSGPFDCMEDPKICIWSFLCPCVRFADNVSMLGIMSYWLGLGLMTCVWLLNGVSGGAFIWLVSAFAWMLLRQKFRNKFSMEGQHECSYLLGDYLLYAFCVPCAIAQEARHLDLAAKADHEAVKPQRPDEELLSAPPQVVGQP